MANPDVKRHGLVRNDRERKRLEDFQNIGYREQLNELRGLTPCGSPEKQ